MEERLEDYVVSGLIDFPDIAYDEHADLLYDLAGQVVRHFRTYLSEEEAGAKCCAATNARSPAPSTPRCRTITGRTNCRIRHEVRQGFTELKKSAYTAAREAPLDYRVLARRQEQHGAISVRRVQQVPAHRRTSSNRIPNASSRSFWSAKR